MQYDIFTQQRKNRRTTFFLMLGFFAFVVAVGLALDVYREGSLNAVYFPISTIVAGGVASVNGFVSYYYGSSLVLRSTGASELDINNQSHKQLRNVVTEMALASGLPMPGVYVMPDKSPNAFATGRDPKTSSIAVTQGLLDVMTRDELQAVVAHEMGHIKNADTLMMTVVAVLMGTVSILCDWALRAWRYGGFVKRRRDVKGGGLHPLVLILIALFILLSPLISRMIAMMVSRSREYLADTSSAEFTRNPLALATALEKIKASSEPVWRAHKGTAHLFISDPLKRPLDDKEGFLADVFSTHPPIDKRIERLKHMAYVYAGKG